jgi:hypothetical protein
MSPVGGRRRLSEAERKIGELTMENAILRRAAEKGQASDPAAEAAEIAMDTDFPLSRVGAVLGASRSTVYHCRSRDDALGCRPGSETPPLMTS